MTLDHAAVGRADHEVVERHLQVVEAARREHHVAVGEAGAEVAGGALDETGPQHLLRGPEDLLFYRQRVGRGLCRAHPLSSCSFGAGRTGPAPPRWSWSCGASAAALILCCPRAPAERAGRAPLRRGGPGRVVRRRLRSSSVLVLLG